VITARAFAGKHYAVYGLARSGLATVEALLASGAKVTAWDAKEEARAKVPAGAEIANLDEADLSKFDSLVVTPGLPLNRHPIAKRAREAGVEIIGDIELFARARPELPPHKVVGITGTNGKSTTTSRCCSMSRPTISTGMRTFGRTQPQKLGFSKCSQRGLIRRVTSPSLGSTR
jgi:UDP-N-acetylmuramoylalanine--D-glutamate ligase